MIIDPSAILSILREETDAARLKQAIADAPIRRLSTASFLEAAIVVDGAKDPIASAILDRFLNRMGVIFEPVTEGHARLARAAYRDFGKGSGHPARLNFGDCFAYALAKDKDEPLLFKGADFGHTDVRSAI